MKRTLNTTLQTALAMACVVLLLLGCQKSMQDSFGNTQNGGGKEMSPKELKDFVQVNLVADITGYNSQLLDVNLVNARGISFLPSGVAIVASEGKGKCTNYTIDGHTAAPGVDIPCASGTGLSHPTAQVSNYTSGFILPNGSPAKVIFVSSDGVISGWNSGSAAVMMANHSPGAAYYGVTIAFNAGSPFIYVANFAQNKIEVYDNSWHPVNKSFSDPNLPTGYSPFNIQKVSDGKLYVTYAKKNAAGQPEFGNGNGYINVYSPAGVLLQRFASAGKLNAPWGIVKAPSSFWGWGSQISNIILVGNNGDGRVNAFTESGDFIGPLYVHGKTLEVEGLWGMAFPAAGTYNSNYLYFAAGPGDGSHGIYGYIKSKSFN